MENLNSNQNFYSFQRISDKKDFEAFRNDENQKIITPNFQIIIKPNSFNYPRMAVIVPKKIIKKAVRRNLVKRIVRERFRKSTLIFQDYLIIARKYTLFSTNQQMQDDLEKNLLQFQVLE